MHAIENEEFTDLEFMKMVEQECSEFIDEGYFSCSSSQDDSTTTTTTTTTTTDVSEMSVMNKLRELEILISKPDSRYSEYSSSDSEDEIEIPKITQRVKVTRRVSVVWKGSTPVPRMMISTKVTPKIKHSPFGVMGNFFLFLF